MSFVRRNRLASIMRRAHKAARRLRAHFGSYRAALAFALRRIYAEQAARAYLVKHAGRDLLARFVKADGSVRMMRFVYEGDRSRQSDGCVRVYDLDRGDWRTLNLDTCGFIRSAVSQRVQGRMQRAA